jgi:hypothetical protein
MDIAVDEFTRLQQLLAAGTISDDEFSKYKSAYHDYQHRRSVIVATFGKTGKRPLSTRHQIRARTKGENQTGASIR